MLLLEVRSEREREREQVAKEREQVAKERERAQVAKVQERVQAAKERVQVAKEREVGGERRYGCERDHSYRGRGHGRNWRLHRSYRRLVGRRD